MVDMEVIQAHYPWSWRLTITLHIKQASEFTEQEVLAVNRWTEPAGRQRLVAQRHQQGFSGGEVAGTRLVRIWFSSSRGHRQDRLTVI
jgi:hypothetical protein